MPLMFLTVVVMLLVAYAHSREGVLTAVSMTVNIFLAGLFAFCVYEPLADELEGMFRDTFLAGCEDALSLAVPFALALGVLRLVSMTLANTEIALPALAQQIGAALCGLVSGYLLAGFLVCMLQTLPWKERFLGFEPGADANVPKIRRLLPPDRVWLAMMQRASAGPLAWGTEFDPDGTFTLRYARLRRQKETGGN